jgi:lipopolysaccharide cholinephosphotransferase
MLYVVQEICKKHNIHYWVDGGTLLGAIRHNGFIPWDDDIDIMMLPEDYDRFIKIAKYELDEPYFLQTDWTDNVYFCHAKIRRSDTTAILAKDVPAKFQFNQGVFIDIFPMDFVPSDNENEYRQYVDHMWMIKNEMLLSRSRNWLYERDNEECKAHTNFLRDMFDSLRRKYLNKTDTVANLSLPTLKKDIRKKLSEFDDTLYVPFEMLVVPIPSGWDSILRRLYGDYMTPVQGGSNHGDILFDTHVSYKDTTILKNKNNVEQ